MTDLLSNTFNYIPITRNLFKKLQNIISNILKRHKIQDTPLCPIISLINSSTYFLAKILYDEYYMMNYG